MNSRMHFNKELNSIFLIFNKQGIAIISLEGEILFHDEELSSTTYSSDLNQLIKTDNRSVTIYKIENKKPLTHR